jgi:DNA invertase Pin-like site-specific DNA recombinase
MPKPAKAATTTTKPAKAPKPALTRLYLRASTDGQDATRARAALETFAEEHGLLVAGTYVESASGASLQRPELFRLLDDSKPGDLILLEQIDRLSRLTEEDWKRLRTTIEAKGVRVVALDLPTSWMMAGSTDAFTARMLGAVNGMLLDMLAAVARKDYEDRRRRQDEGIAKAKAAGRYRGRPEDTEKLAQIERLLKLRTPWTQIEKLAKCSNATIAKVAKRLREAAEA